MSRTKQLTDVAINSLSYRELNAHLSAYCSEVISRHPLDFQAILKNDDYYLKIRHILNKIKPKKQK